MDAAFLYCRIQLDKKLNTTRRETGHSSAILKVNSAFQFLECNNFYKCIMSSKYKQCFVKFQFVYKSCILLLHCHAFMHSLIQDLTSSVMTFLKVMSRAWCSRVIEAFCQTVRQ